MARAPNTATREYISPSEQSLLEEYGVTSAEFDRVRHDDRGNGSEMVKGDKPTLDLKPPTELAQDIDREAFDNKWAEKLQRTQEQNNTPEPEQER